MSALGEGTWGLTPEFDRLSERLFAIAQKQGVLLSMRIRRPRVRPVRVTYDREARVVPKAKPAKKKAAKK